MKASESLLKISVPVWERSSNYGVYFLLDNQEVVYIGSSTQGIKRVFDHFRNGKGPKRFDSYAFISMKPVSKFSFKHIEELKAMEASYMLKYKPKYNKTLPSGMCNDGKEDFITLVAYCKGKGIELMNFKKTLYQSPAFKQDKIRRFGARFAVQQLDEEILPLFNKKKKQDNSQQI